MKRWALVLLALGVLPGRPAQADTGPPPRITCGALGEGEPCWIEGKHAGACRRGDCRVGEAPTPPPPPPAPPPRSGPRPCQLSPGPFAADGLIAVALVLVGLGALGRRRGRA